VRAINVDYTYNGRPTITKEEYLELKESIRNTFDPNEISVLNKSITKQKCFDILFNDEFKIEKNIEYLHFYNIVREFVVKKKTFHNWKVLQDYKPIKEIKEIRKEKIRRIEDEHLKKYILYSIKRSQ
jgi:hypothetical protein